MTRTTAAPSLVPQTPDPRTVLTPDGVRIATYDVGDPGAPTILAVHGFASSARANWFATGWVRELVRADYRVIAMDQRGHGASDKPHEPDAYSMEHLVGDVEAVLDTYLLDEVGLVGYSLGARVGWHAAIGTEQRITRAVLGGIPDGRPLTRFRIDLARGHIEHGGEVPDRITQAYLDLAARTPGNDLNALVALVEGLQGGLQPDPRTTPRQPVLFATGSEDGILDASKRIAAVTPSGEFFEIPGRNHFNAPTARTFRDRALEFLGRAPEPVRAAPLRPDGADERVSAWVAGRAALLLALDGDPVPTGAGLDAQLAARWDRWQQCLRRAADESR